MCRAATVRLAAGVAAALLTAGTVHAQRFDAARRETVAAIPGLDVVTIRDTALNACYTLFIMEPGVQPARPSRADPASLQDLAEERDRRLSALLVVTSAAIRGGPRVSRPQSASIRLGRQQGPGRIRAQASRQRNQPSRGTARAHRQCAAPRGDRTGAMRTDSCAEEVESV